jgi:hypothetical protein
MASAVEWLWARKRTFTDPGIFLGAIAGSDYTRYMKSAFELAMSRLEKESPTQKLTEEQKRRLAEVDAEITAKIAEKKVFLEEEIKKAAGNPETEAQLRKQLAMELARLEEKREVQKTKIRDSVSA